MSRDKPTGQIATLKIWRGSKRDDGRWQSYEVPFEPGQSVLDGLRWLRVNQDPSLAVRFSCINANACKECMIQLDGKTVYACTARLESREMTLTPLPNKALIRDLVTEIAPRAGRFAPSPKKHLTPLRVLTRQYAHAPRALQFAAGRLVPDEMAAQPFIKVGGVIFH